MPDNGYEMWVTTPEEMIVAEPFTKKIFKGGMYAAHMIKKGVEFYLFIYEKLMN